MDLISNLPECIITRILSSLPAKDAVRTSVLSKSWEYRWNYIYNINVEDYRYFVEETTASDHVAHFPNFMDALLANTHNFKSFRLCCWRTYDASRIRTWISTALRRNVETVYIYYVLESCSPEDIILSRSLLNCTSLRSLTLNVCCTLKVLVNNSFQNLTTWDLGNFTILNDNSHTDTLAFDFPLLKTLKLCDCKWLNVRFLELCVPALSSFVFRNDDIEDDECIFKIIGVWLDEFKIYTVYPGKFLLIRSAVVSAALLSNCCSVYEGMAKKVWVANSKVAERILKSL